MVEATPGSFWVDGTRPCSQWANNNVGGHLGDHDSLIGLQAAVFLCVHLLLLSLASATVRLLSLLLIMRSRGAGKASQYKFVPVYRSACFCTRYIYFSVLCRFVVSIHACWTCGVLCMFMQLLELMNVYGRHPQACHGPSFSRSDGTRLGCVR